MLPSSRAERVRATGAIRRSRTQRNIPRDDEQGPSSGAVRHKSRSPSRNSTRNSKSSRSDPFISAVAPVSSARVKNLPSASHEDVIVDRGEKLKANIVTGALPLASRRPPSVGRWSDQPQASSSRALPPTPEPRPLLGGTFSGPIAAAEFERLKKEIESLKRSAAESKKIIKKQSKVIEDLKAELGAAKLNKKDVEAQIQTLEQKTKTNDELISSIEVSLQCQICMELLSKPYALSPCGHILCVTCLQEWFRKAPPSASDDDMDVDPEDDADYILHRSKSCPCCRAVVTRRPVPVFLVKAVTSSLLKAKGANSPGPSVQRAPSPAPTDEDPWKGLFPDDDDSDHDDQYDDIWSDDDDEAFSEEEIGHMPHQFLIDHNLFGYYSDGINSDIIEDDERAIFGGAYSEEEDDDIYAASVYVRPRWAPPEFVVDGEDDVPRDRLALMRRGCTDDMIDLFGVNYSHTEGLIAHINSFDEDHWEPGVRFNHSRRRRMSRVFLGFNVDLAPFDHDAEAYMRDVLQNFRHHPDRWLVRSRNFGLGLRDAYRLVLEADNSSEYSNTDTEAWLEEDERSDVEHADHVVEM